MDVKHTAGKNAGKAVGRPRGEQGEGGRGNESREGRRKRRGWEKVLRKRSKRGKGAEK